MRVRVFHEQTKILIPNTKTFLKYAACLHSWKFDLYYLLVYDWFQMGRTIPSFRIASLMEKEEWRSFRKALDKEDRKVFDEMFDISILYNSASVYSAKYVRIHPIFMSIIFHHYKQLLKVSDELQAEAKNGSPITTTEMKI